MASVSDNFNRSDGNLDGSTASGGGTWVEFENDQWKIESNEARVNRGSSNQDQSARLDGVDLDGDDHEVEATWSNDNLPGSSYLNFGLLARKEDNATKTMYVYTISGLGTQTTLGKFVAGSFTSLGDGSTNPAVTDTIRLKCDGTTIAGYLNDGEEVSVTDSAIAGATYVQVGLHSDIGSPNPAGFYVRLDDWSGTDLAGGTLYYQSAAGTLTSAGGMVKEGQKPLAGALTSAGAIARLTATSLAGSLSSAGAVVKQTAKPLTGALTTAGAVATVKTFLRSFAGTLTTAGAVTKETAKPLTGALTTAGAIAKQTAKPLAGTLSTAGTAAKGLYVSLAGTLTSAGVLESVKNPVLAAIDLTLRARSMAFTLVSRAFDLALRSRSADFTLRDREE